MYELGYYTNNTINESFTANTAECVKKFEVMNGLTANGVADPVMQELFFSNRALRADGTLVVPETKVAENESLPVETQEPTDMITTVTMP